MEKILLLTDAMGQGGAERQLACLAIELKKSNHDVRLVTFYQIENFYSRQLEENDITTEVYASGKNPLLRSLVIYRIVKKWMPSMVVAYKPGTAMSACITRSFFKFNLVVSERNTTQALTFSEKLKFALYRFSDHIVPNSYSQAEFIKKHFSGMTDKVSVITNMVDTNLFVPGENCADNSVIQIITTARITPQKNVLKYIETAAILKRKGLKAHFNWYGRKDCSEDYWTEITRMIRDCMVEDFITFHGPTGDIVSEYQKSDIFFLPSIYEGFPNVLCEAMSCGLTCVASNVCDNGIILTDAAFLCDPYSSTDMADKLMKVASLSSDRRRETGMNNRDMIVKLCSPQNFVNKYLMLNDKV